VSCVQTDELRVKQRVTTAMELQSKPDSEGREWTWIDTSSELDIDVCGGATGAYMFSVRFRSKSAADQFKSTFDSVRFLVKFIENGRSAPAPAQSLEELTTERERKE